MNCLVLLISGLPFFSLYLSDTSQFVCITSVQFSSVAQLCQILYDPLSIINSPSLLKRMSIDLVMPSNHLILSSPSPPAFNLSQHQGLLQ